MSGAIDVFAMPDADDLDDEVSFEDAVDQPVITDPNAVGALGATHFPNTRGKRVRRKVLYGLQYLRDYPAVEPSKVFCGGGFPLDVIGIHFSSTPPGPPCAE